MRGQWTELLGRWTPALASTDVKIVDESSRLLIFEERPSPGRDCGSTSWIMREFDFRDSASGPERSTLPIRRLVAPWSRAGRTESPPCPTRSATVAPCPVRDEPPCTGGRWVSGTPSHADRSPVATPPLRKARVLHDGVEYQQCLEMMSAQARRLLSQVTETFVHALGAETASSGSYRRPIRTRC